MPPKYEFRKNEFMLKGLLMNSKLCKSYLIETILIAYGDVEKTGTHNQYYERYKYRFYLSNLLIFLLRDKNYEMHLDSIARDNYELFDRYTHFFIGDITDSLQDGISHLKGVKSKLISSWFRVRRCRGYIDE